MKRIGIVEERCSKLQDRKKFIEEYEAKVNRFIGKGWKVIASNISSDGYYSYFYTMMEIEEN